MTLTVAPPAEIVLRPRNAVVHAGDELHDRQAEAAAAAPASGIGPVKRSNAWPRRGRLSNHGKTANNSSINAD